MESTLKQWSGQSTESGSDECYKGIVKEVGEGAAASVGQPVMASPVRRDVKVTRAWVI